MKLPGLVAVLGVSAAAIGQPQTFQFTLDPVASGLSGTLTAGVDTSGTLVGNWDAVTNPTGTRTKPGLFGTFGPTENVPVPTTFGGDIDGPISTDAAGSLRLRLDPGAMTCVLSGLAIDFVPGEPVVVPGSGTIDFDSFRTRAPDSTFPGVPVSLPIDSEITDLQGVQSIPATGTLKGGIPGVFLFEVAAVIEFSGEITVAGNVTELPPAVLIILFQGTVTVSGTAATLVSSQPVTLVVNQTPGGPIPQFPLDIPTVLPAGGTAHLLMDLVLDQMSFNLNSTLDLEGDGVLVACYPDCNGDAALTIGDFGCFQAKFAGGDPYADCNGSGGLSIADFGCFQAAFAAGCP